MSDPVKVENRPAVTLGTPTAARTERPAVIMLPAVPLKEGDVPGTAAAPPAKLPATIAPSPQPAATLGRPVAITGVSAAEDNLRKTADEMRRALYGEAAGILDQIPKTTTQAKKYLATQIPAFEGSVTSEEFGLPKGARLVGGYNPATNRGVVGATLERAVALENFSAAGRVTAFDAFDGRGVRVGGAATVVGNGSIPLQATIKVADIGDLTKASGNIKAGPFSLNVTFNQPLKHGSVGFGLTGDKNGVGAIAGLELKK